MVSYNEIPQDFNLAPGLEFDSGEIISDLSNTQLSKSSKTYLEFASVLLGTKNKNKYQLSATVSYAQDRLNTALWQNQDLLEEEFQNALDYHLLETKLQGFMNFNFGKLSIKPILQFSNFASNQKEIGNQNLKLNQWTVNPSLLITYRVNSKMRFFSTYAYNENRPFIGNMCSGYILTSSRSLRRNLYTDQLLASHFANLGFGIHDMYRQFNLNFNLNYSEQKNSFFTKVDITKNLTKTEFFLLPEASRNYGANLSVEKYVPAIKSTLKLNGNFMRVEYKNIVNDSDLRNNQLDNYHLNFSAKTALKFPINFENELNLQHFYSKSKRTSESFENTGISNSFKILVKPAKLWFGSVSLDYFQTSTQKSNEYYFVDAFLRYQTPNNLWHFYLNAKNLTNNKFFEEINISDYYRSTSLQNLNKTYLMLGMRFNF